MRTLYTLGWTAAVSFLTALTVSAQTLSIGMYGSQVTELQNHLVAAGYLARTIDGDYGSTTKTAVALFQKDKGLAVTGAADDKTQESIREAMNQGYRPGGGVVYAEGNRGSMITDMQLNLQKAGYLKGGVDGVYGKDTADAVKALQKHKGIPVSGVIDEMTYAVLENQSLSADEAANLSSAGKADGSSTFLYQKGDRGTEVSSLQRKLKKMDYLKGAVDGIYGNDTEEAVRKFQKKKKLPVTGKVNKAAFDAISSAYAEESKDNVLTPGDSGKKVIRLQNKLLLHGYNPGNVDGVYGEGTADAVRRFQAEENLARTGIADGDVWDRLENAPKFTGKYKKVFHMQSTAYTPMDGGGSGHTALGNYAGKGHAAVDPKVIPLGSLVYIEGYGYAICDDIGGNIHGNIIDVGVDNYDQAYEWGYKTKVNVYLIE